MSDIPLPPRRAARVRKAVEVCEQSPAVAAIPKPRLAYERRNGVAHLAAACFGSGVGWLLGWLNDVDRATHDEWMLPGLVMMLPGLVLMGRAGLEWRRRGFRRRRDFIDEEKNNGAAGTGRS